MININTQSTEVPNIIGATWNPDKEMLLANGWRDYDPSSVPPIPDGYERLVSVWIKDPTEVDPITSVDDYKSAVFTYTDTLKQDRLDAEKAADLEANHDRYVLEDQYVLLCNYLTNSSDNTVLGMDVLQSYLMAMAGTNFPREVLLSQYVVALQVGLQRLGGIMWWDSCRYHGEDVILTEAQQKHDYIISHLP